MRSELQWNELLRVGINIAFIGLLFYFIVEVVWGQILVDFVISLYDSESGLLYLIIMIGFLIGFLISILTISLSTDMIHDQYVFYGGILALFTSLILWVVVSYAGVLTKFPWILSGLTLFQKVIVFPRIMAYFAIFVIENVVTFWVFNLLTYDLIFIIFLKFLGATKRKGYSYEPSYL